MMKFFQVKELYIRKQKQFFSHFYKNRLQLVMDEIKNELSSSIRREEFKKLKIK